MTAGALPVGLSLSSGGALTGTPTAAGTFNFTVTATDSSTGTGPYAGTQSYSMTIAPPTVTVSPGSLPDGTSGVSYNQTVTASGGAAPYALSFSGTLPTGLSLSSGGVLSGTPTAAGTFNFTITATDSTPGGSGGPFTSSANYILTINAPTIALSPSSLPAGTGGTSYSQTLTAAGGTAPYTFNSAGSLPPGLTLAPGGAITGVPTTAGTFSFTVTATDNLSFTSTRTYSITVGAPTIAIAPSTLPPGDMGIAYNQTIVASGGTAPYTYALASGTLPPGLTLNPTTGVLSGTPTGHGPFTFTIKATDNFTFAGTRTYKVAIGTAFVEKRTKEVIGNFVARRADALTSNEPSRLRDHRRHRGSLFGGSERGEGTGGGSAAWLRAVRPSPLVPHRMRTAMWADFTFATSLQQLMAAKKQAAPPNTEGASRPDGMMTLGVTGGGLPEPTTASAVDVWVEGYSTHFDDDASGSSGNVGIMYVGADYQILPGLLIGGLMQFDFAEEKSAMLGSNADGHGWMLGPYLSARLTENLFFDARAAWGESKNSISPFGTYADRADGERWLVRADLTGDWQWDRWRFSPTAGIAYFEEEINAYIDSNGIRIDGQSYTLGRLNFGPEVGYSISLANGLILEPLVSVQGIWDFEGTHPVTFNEILGGTPDLRAKVQTGVTLVAPWGYSIRGTGFIDGLGADDYKAYGGQLMINMPFN